MVNYEYPTTKELREINPEKIQDLTRRRPTFDVFPLVDSIYWTLEWKQKDNWRGFQQLRGLNGEPTKVSMVGERSFSAQPGVYGEFMTVDEKEMTLRAQQAGVNTSEPIDISDLVTERQDYLNFREIELIEYVHWKALLDGQIAFLGKTGTEYMEQFPIQTTTFSDWSILTTATPILDFITLKLSTSGKSVAFDSGATVFANAKTVSDMLRNQNPNDLGGQLSITPAIVGAAKPVKTLEEINTLLKGHNLPSIVEYDEGYNRESDGAFQKWIPDDVLSIIGRRTNGDKLGEYRMVRNAQNPNMAPGRYEKVIDHGENRVPRLIEIHRGHNGGLCIFYGSAIVRATC